jgi:hypothetical protein
MNPMKKNILIHFSLCLLMATFTNSFSQGSISLSLGPTFPTGHFADGNPWDSRSGLAGPGLGLSVSYLYQIPESSLGLFASASVFADLTSKDAIDAWEDFNPNAEISLPKAVNLPLTAGISYILKTDQQFSLYCKAGLGASFLKYSGLEVKESGYQDYGEDYDVSTALCYVLAAGVTGKKLILEVTYMDLGEHTISGTWNVGSTSEVLPTAKKSVGLIAVLIGWKVL